jgi:2-octaprenyl-6-methoxyphenol hydroxylase
MADEVLVAGDGPVACLLALALAERGIEFSLCGENKPAPDRPIALSWGTKLLLERFGAFEELRATPIESIHVSHRGSFGRTLIRAADEGVAALGHVVSYANLRASLRRRLSGPVIDTKVIHYSPSAQGDAMVAVTEDAHGTRTERRAQLLVLAEGGRQGGKDSASRDYGQSAIVSRVKTEFAHHNRAWERFTPEGPLALLPSGDELALVWSTGHAGARALQGLRDAAFLARLHESFGGRLGRFVQAAPRSSFPVALRHERGSPMPRVLAIGNAAQALHPVAGQGLNLGLRDAWELAQALGEQSGDPGTARFVHAFLRARALDRSAGIRFTDALVRVFSNSNPALALGRGTALAALDVAAPARSFLARRMMFGARAW